MLITRTKAFRQVPPTGSVQISTAETFLHVSYIPVSYTHLDVYKRQQVGKLLREAKEAGKDPVLALTETLECYEVGRGTITRKEDSDEHGYYWGTVTVDCGKDELKYWFKNENHVLWKNGEPYITSPDLICAVDTDTGEPVPNPSSKVGQNVAVVVLPCKPEQKDTTLLTPKYFGFDIDHVPLKKVLGMTE